MKGYLTTATRSEYHFRDERVDLGKSYEYALETIDIDGLAKRHETTVSLKVDMVFAFELGQNYPNPFNPVTTIRYTVPRRFSAAKKLPVCSGMVRSTTGATRRRGCTFTGLRWGASS